MAYPHVEQPRVHHRLQARITFADQDRLLVRVGRHGAHGAAIGGSLELARRYQATARVVTRRLCFASPRNPHGRCHLNPSCPDCAQSGAVAANRVLASRLGSLSCAPWWWLRERGALALFVSLGS